MTFGVSRWTGAREMNVMAGVVRVDMRLPGVFVALREMLGFVVVAFPVKTAAEGGNTPAVAYTGGSVELRTGLRCNPVIVVEREIHRSSSGQHAPDKDTTTFVDEKVLKMGVERKFGGGSTARAGRSLGGESGRTPVKEQLYSIT